MSPSPLDDRPRVRPTAARRATAVALAASLSLVTVSCAAATSSSAGSTADLRTAETGLFDSSQVHDVEVTFDEADYAEMIATYTATGDKSWIRATVAVDGTTFEDVGLRLKGNSSLRGVSADADPSTMPWLVRLDKYLDGQALGGVTSFVVRSNTTTTALNEAVALELIGLSGLATQQATPVRLRVNDGEPVLRLVIENPDDAWAESVFDTEGLLYKSEAGGDWSYRGDDPASYEGSFDQETGDVEDLTPLIGFLEWLDAADDETFAAELDDHLDVDAFATYLAVQDLVGNVDDISGPGNNSYLRYDVQTDRFTVVSWDQNLSFGVLNGGGPMGGGGAPGEDGTGREMPDGFEPPDGMTRPEGTTLPEGFERPDDATIPDEADTPDAPTMPGGLRAGGGLGGNVLAERFMADDAFAGRYEVALAELTANLVDSGVAADVLAAWTDVLATQADDLVDDGTITTEAAAISASWE